MSTLSKGGTLENEILTVNEVAIYLRVSRVTVWRWCQHGIIPASRFGRNWRIRRADLLLLLEAPSPLTSTPVPLYLGDENNITPQGLPLSVLGLGESNTDSNLDRD